MSAIFGFINFENPPPVEMHRQLAAMQDNLGNWGPDGYRVIVKESAGFGLAMLNISPESIYEHLPSWSDETGILFTASARLDNRDDLCDVFSLSEPEKEKTPDTKLAELSWLKWGKQAPHYLFGDWCFAAFDLKNRKLFIARDRLGNTSLKYFFKPPFFAFAPSEQTLLSTGVMPDKLNEIKLGASMVNFYDNELARQTNWKDIFNLVPAHNIVVSKKELIMNKYWDFDNINLVRYSNESDYYDEFRNLANNAVKVRLRGDRPAGTTLSSGLDSGMVSTLAADILNQQNKRLPAFTSVPIFESEHLVKGWVANEWDTAGSLAKKYPNIDHIPITGIELAPHKAIKKAVDMYDDTFYAVINAFWLLSMLEEAQNRNLGILLTGQLGNAGISWNGGTNRHFFDFLYGNWKTLAVSLRQNKINYNVSWKVIFKFYLLNPIMKPIREMASLRFKKQANLWGPFSPIKPEFAEQIDLKAQIMCSDSQSLSYKFQHPDKERRNIFYLNSASSGISWHRSGTLHHLDVRDPTADIKLLKFCFGVPNELFTKNASNRMLIRNAMKGIMPKEIRTNTKRGRQGADVPLRLIQHKKEIEAELIEIGQFIPVREIIDLKKIMNALQTLDASGSPYHLRSSSSLILKGLMYGYFLKKHY